MAIRDPRDSEAGFVFKATDCLENPHLEELLIVFGLKGFHLLTSTNSARGQTCSVIPAAIAR
jgi:hypothetical protein